MGGDPGPSLGGCFCGRLHPARVDRRLDGLPDRVLIPKLTVLCTVRCPAFFGCQAAILWEFPKTRGTLFRGPCSKDPAI